MSPLVLTLAVGLFVLGGTILGIFTTGNKKFVDFSIGGAFGVITALIVLELIPHAYSHLSLSSNIRTILMLIIMILIGFLVMNILDKFVPHHEHEEKHEHHHKDDTCHHKHLGHIGFLATLALILHNIIEGMTLYATATSSIDAGYMLCIGIGLHNIPIGIMVSNTINNKKKSLMASVALALSSFIGGLLMMIISPVNEFMIGILISLTIGMMIYLTLVELLSQIIHSKNKKIAILGIIIGLILIFISVQFGHHH